MSTPRRILVSTLIIASTAVGFAGLVVALGSPQLVVPVIIGALGGGLSSAYGYEQGRAHGRKLGRWEFEHELIIDAARAFVLGAEQALAAAPEDLDEETEQMRRRLQRDYHMATQILAEDEERRGQR